MPTRIHHWDCYHVKPLLPGWPDGELAPAVREAVEAHLEACERCRSEAVSYRMLGRALRADPAPAANLPSGTQAVDWILRQEERRARPGWISLVSGGRFGLALGLATAAVWVTLVARFDLGSPQRRAVPSLSAAPEALPALIVVDDEQTGRQVLLGPDRASAGYPEAPAPP